MKTIESGLSVSDINHMIKLLESYKKQFIERCNRFIRKLAEEGMRVATTEYAKGEGHPNDPPINVTVVQTDNGYSITASGRQIVFMEFGAGTRTATSHPMAQSLTSQTGIEVRPGSYSEQNTQEFAALGFWVYPPKSSEHKTYEFIEPTPGLWRAEQEIERKIEKIAKEVFK